MDTHCDFYYTLWHDPHTAEVIAELSQRFDIFRCSIGDIDTSFEFEYYQVGKLVRKLEFDDNIFKGTKAVTADIGPKLPAEPDTLADLVSSSEKMFPAITKSLGIVRVTDPLQYRFYKHYG